MNVQLIYYHYQKKRYNKNDLKRILYSTVNEEKSEKITITDSEIVIDGQESLNEESEKTNLEELAGKYAEEMDKTDVESFLSPEEEETLLSLYDEELKDLIGETDSEIPENEIGMKKSNIEDKEETLFEQDSEESELLAGEDLTSTKSIESESLSEEIPELETDEFPDQIEIESESTNEGIEKEIVDEMIRDFIGEEKPSESFDETSDNVLEKDKQTLDAELPDIETLENELLNIFEDVDKYNAGVPSEEISFEEVKEIPDDNVNQAKDLFSPFLEEDGLDDYIKSIDEIVSSDRIEKAALDEIKKEIVEKLPEPPEPVAVEERVAIEKKVNEEKEKVSRVIRPKDLFSYLRRKEVKKIVSFIFANDEEDFTNTIERLMDCHSYKEASEILKAVFTSYKISPYSKEAITFTNSVSNYFRQA